MAVSVTCLGEGGIDVVNIGHGLCGRRFRKRFRCLNRRVFGRCLHLAALAARTRRTGRFFFRGGSFSRSSRCFGCNSCRCRLRSSSCGHHGRRLFCGIRRFLTARTARAAAAAFFRHGVTGGIVSGTLRGFRGLLRLTALQGLTGLIVTAAVVAAAADGAGLVTLFRAFVLVLTAVGAFSTFPASLTALLRAAASVAVVTAPLLFSRFLFFFLLFFGLAAENGGNRGNDGGKEPLFFGLCRLWRLFVHRRHIRGKDVLDNRHLTRTCGLVLIRLQGIRVVGNGREVFGAVVACHRIFESFVVGSQALNVVVRRFKHRVGDEHHGHTVAGFKLAHLCTFFV